MVKFNHIPVKMAKIKKHNISSVGKTAEQTEHPVTAGGNMKRHNHFGEPFGVFFKS